MGPGHFADDFKCDAVAQIIERGYPVAPFTSASVTLPLVAQDAPSRTTCSTSLRRTARPPGISSSPRFSPARPISRHIIELRMFSSGSRACQNSRMEGHRDPHGHPWQHGLRALTKKRLEDLPHLVDYGNDSRR